MDEPYSQQSDLQGALCEHRSDPSSPSWNVNPREHHEQESVGPALPTYIINSHKRKGGGIVILPAEFYFTNTKSMLRAGPLVHDK